MDYRDVELRVLQGDALSYSSDLLVLKYAQASYGVDRQAVDDAGIDTATLPAAGDSLLVQQPSGLAPRNLLFMGVEPITVFDYRSIREFSRRALNRAAAISQPVREISMTLHGTGFGLDETEAFESEVAGIVEALDSGEYPASLLTVSIIETSESRADRMRDVLIALLSLDENDTEAEVHAARGEPRTRRIDSVGYDSSARPHAFVAMPFAESFEDVFYFGIAPPVRAVGLLCEKSGEVAFTGDIIHRIRERIVSASFVIADLSDANPNVYLEVGYAWGVKRPCILLCNRKTDLKFDLQGQRCLFYSSIKELEKSLSAELAALTNRRISPRVFVAYAQEDKQLYHRLLIHLGGVRRDEDWTDGEIVPGQELAPPLIRRLKDADIILLLVTPGFLASEFFSGVELARALGRHRRGQATVIPVILKPASWERAGLGALQALPRDGKAVSFVRNPEAAYVGIAEGIRRAVEAWRARMTDLSG